MTALLLATVADDVELEAQKAELGTSVFVVGNRVPLSERHDLSSITTLRGSAFPVAGLEGVYLRASWSFIPSGGGNWLKSWRSDFGLLVGETPFVRIEVDPNKPDGSWLQVHIYIQGESTLLGYLRGTQGQERTRLDALHLPVGGFRFRPSLEDFLEFAIDERLIPGKEGWQETVEKSRQGYLRKQFNAMVARHPDWAQEVLDGIVGEEE
jgi:hypothetical protein